MTLPEEYKKSDSFNSFSKPTAKQLSSRPIVGPPLLKIPTYKIEFILGTVDNSYKELDTMEVRPIELDASILFYNRKNKEGPLLPISFINDIKVISQTIGIFRKKEKVMVEISFNNRDKENIMIRINLKNEQINEFLQQVKEIQNKLQNDNTSWTTSLLNFKTETGIISSIEIYPMIPFLSKGEKIIWKNISTKGPENKKKVTLLDLVTNYRIFQYNYIDHKGSFIWINEIKDVIVNNHRHKSNSNTNRSYGKIRYSIPGYKDKDSKITSTTIGDIVVITEGKPQITFKDINDPNELTGIIKSMNKQSNFSVSSIIPPIQINKTFPNIIEDDKIYGNNKKVTSTLLNDGSLICGNCSNINSINSKFCNKCGQKLNVPNKCSKCNQINVIDALFCNTCGNKL
ncbi:MAG: zinc ribbon domain-containing protein [Thermoproteota archaeon]|nr:zinc ribbon domain-containing protein [Thermoproteota archaeon]